MGNGIENPRNEHIREAGENSISIPDVYPVGVKHLQPMRCKLVDPFLDYGVSSLAGLITASTGLRAIVSGLSKEDPSHSFRLSRRNFLKMMAGTGLALASGEVLFSIQDLESLINVNMTVGRAYQNLSLLNYHEQMSYAKKMYLERLKTSSKMYLGDIKSSETTSPNATIYDVSLFAGDGAYRLSCYTLESGCVAPVIPTDTNSIAIQSNQLFLESDTPMVAAFNATAPDAIYMGRAVQKTVQNGLSHKENVVIYGSSSLFIPDDTDAYSPIWLHAQNRLREPNNLFPELSYRTGDPTHQGLGFTKDGFLRLVSQGELENVVSRRQLSQDLTHACLQQFCFDPREKSGIPDEFVFGDDYHRNLNILLQTTTGKQLILSGDHMLLMRNQDYAHVIRELADKMDVEFSLAACLDLGLVGGFILRGDKTAGDEGNLKRFPSQDNPLESGLLHTCAVHLVHKSARI